MRQMGPASLLALLAVSCGLSAQPRPPLAVTYLANEGYLLEAAGQRVLIDALFRQGVEGYARLSPATRSRLEAAAAPFADAAFALATHFHADHFDPEAVAAHLGASPGTRFLSTPQSLERLRAATRVPALLARAEAVLPPEGRREVREHRGVRVQVLNIHHGRKRPIENLGLLVELGGYRVLHIGDSEATAADLRAAAVAMDRIDVFFVPYWYLTYDDGRLAVRDVAARHTVVMHVPTASGDEAIRRAGGFRALFDEQRKAFPNALWLENELDRIALR